MSFKKGASCLNEIELRDLLVILKRKSWIIVLVTLLLLLTCCVLTFCVMEPQYEAFATFVVGVGRPLSHNENFEYSDVLLNEKLVSTYEEIAKSISISDTVVKNLNLNITYEEFAKKVKVVQVENTQVIKIKIRDKDPVLAARIANEFSKNFLTHIMAIMKMENVQILDRAKVPVKPISPRPALYLAISGLLGVFSSVFMILIYQYFDTSIKTPKDVENNLGLPVIGRVFTFTKGKDEGNRGVILQAGTWSPIAEAIRGLRANIQFLSASKNIKTIVITSAGIGEGKSTISAGLAVSVAQVNKKVLLIDCDLRRPALHTYFGGSNDTGITNYLSEDVAYRDLIQYGKTDYLYFLPSGPIPPNPAELLASYKFEIFLKDIVQEYDMVIMDSPPIGLVTDAAVLSTVSDGVIFVCSVKQCTIEAAKYALSLIRDVNARVLGVVLNKIPLKESPYYKHRKYSYYGNIHYRVFKREEG